MSHIALRRVRLAAAALVLGVVPGAALAELPAGVRALIDAAIDTGDAQTVRTVIELARTTNPDDTEELNAIEAAFEADMAARDAQEAAAHEAAIRAAGLFEDWSGRGELGAFHSSGNSSNTGLTASLALTRDGINWHHKLRGRADYQRSNGVTTREQFLAAYEPNLDIDDRLFVFALAQYERDRFQGFSGRYSVSGGLGVRLIERDRMTLSAQAGPAFRRTQRTDGTSSDNFSGLASLDFDWHLSDTISFTQDASALVQAGSSTFVSDSGVQAGIADTIKVRLSYTLEHDTNPPAGAIKTDTLSRITIIYDF